MLALWSIASILSVAAAAPTGDSNELQTRPKINPYPPGALNSRLLASTPGHSATMKNWTEGSATLQDAIPRACFDAVQSEGLKPEDVEVFTTTYDDCDLEWELCRHKDANMTLSTLGNVHGKIPVKARGLVPHLLLVPGTEHLYRTDEILVMGGRPNFSALMHQVGRAIDENCPFPGKTRRCSDTDAWRNAFDRDTYVVDDIARTSQAANFAQIVLHTILNLNFPTGLSSMHTDTNGMSNEILYDDEVKVQAQYCGQYLVVNPDDKCDNFDQKREYVSKSTGEEIKDPFNGA